ncbi:serine/threonine-protein kinase Sgk2, partial [Blumeria hordei DH14]
MRDILAEANYKLLVKKVPVTAFENLFASIKKPASNKKILTSVINIVIEINKEDKSIPLMLPQYSSITKLKMTEETLGYDKITATLTDALKSETSGKIYRNVDGFWDINFKRGKSWCGLVNRIWNSYRNNGQCGIEYVFSSNMDEDALRSWLHAFRDRYLIQLMKEQDFTENNQPAVERRRNDPLVRGKFCHTTKPSQFKGGKSQRTLDFFMESSEIPECEIHNWRDVRVVGEITLSEEKIGIKFNQLMRYVREIIYSQPLRRFVHGFCLHNDHIKFWIIDRAGAYSSGKYDVLEDQEMLVRGLSLYMLMSDEELGLNPVTSYDDADRCFVSSTNDKNETAKLEVNTTPIARPETIVSRGITCFRTIDENYLIKFSWGTGAKENEIKFLSCDKKIPRVTQMISSGNLYQVRTHRKGIKLSINQILEINGVEQSPFCGSRMISHPEEYGHHRGLTLTIL